MSYIVLGYLHTTQKGLQNCFPILLTENLEKAIKTARRADQLGYPLTEEDGFQTIEVWRVEPEAEVNFEQYQYACSPPKNHPMTMTVTMSRGKRFEAWCDQELRKQFQAEEIRS